MWQLYDISKYQRNEQGDLVDPDEWTSIHNVGKPYNEKVLTIDDYLLVEDDYVKTINNFLNGLGVSRVTIKELESDVYYEAIEDVGSGISKDTILLEDHQNVSGKLLDDWIRMCLRGVVWCHLICPNSCFIWFGYDLHVRIGTKKQLENSVTDFAEAGMFIRDETKLLKSTDIYDKVLQLCSVN